eukprot:TRINITY_DN2691_c0_g1_i1.p1 TRINITY_DN2691_c0_g1~~TRINITY_DN2691_c0_g1_i1.p1  ORF type:complete len:142 (+),score=16.07 TRINITY_DN2691_c0_g1_i1:625-1050(+)
MGINAVSFSGHGNIATAGGDGVVVVYHWLGNPAVITRTKSVGRLTALQMLCKDTVLCSGPDGAFIYREDSPDLIDFFPSDSATCCLTVDGDRAFTGTWKGKMYQFNWSSFSEITPKRLPQFQRKVVEPKGVWVPNSLSKKT